MAIAFLDDINLNDNQAQNLVIQRVGTLPTGVEAKVVYDNSSNTIKYYNGGSWIELDGLGGIAGSGTINTVPMFVTNTTTLGDSLYSQNAGATEAKVTGGIFVTGYFKDSSGDIGSAGQLLSSTGTLTNWINAPVSYTKWVLTGDTGTQDIEDGDTVLITGGVGLVTVASATDKLTITPAFDEYSSETPTATSAIIFGQDGDLANSEVRYSEVSGFTLDMFGSPAANIFFNSKKITSLLDPTGAQDAATKAYVDTQLAGSGLLIFQGGYNATDNEPDLDSSPSSLIKKGWSYVVTVAGNFFTEAVEVGDLLIAEQDAPTALANWTTVQNNIGIATATTPGIASFTSGGGLDVDSAGAVIMTAVGSAQTGGASATATTGVTINTKGQVTGFTSTNIAISHTAITDFDTEVDTRITAREFVGTTSSQTTHTFTHNLDTNNVMVQLFDTSSGETVFASVDRTSTSVVTATTAASASLTALITKIG
tara:strand:- start:28 stop:1473 length:1446 start_codon:yes stop_codon:yes gene_type:complete